MMKELDELDSGRKIEHADSPEFTKTGSAPEKLCCDQRGSLQNVRGTALTNFETEEDTESVGADCVCVVVFLRKVFLGNTSMVANKSWNTTSTDSVFTATIVISKI